MMPRRLAPADSSSSGLSTRIGMVLDDRFELRHSIGAGGAGTLWVATDRTTGGDVAVKLLHRALRGTENARRRIEREAEILVRLEHDNVARAIALSIDGARPYLVMELVPGHNLLEAMHERLDRRVRFEASEIAALATGIGGALQYAHDVGVVHRDVKPANIMMRPDGVAVLLDFGIARIEEVSKDLATTAGRMMGTYTYMAPEQTRGDLEITGAVDQFALAVVLFEVVTQRRLWVRGVDGEPLPMEQSAPQDRNDLMQLRDRILGGARPAVSRFVETYAPLDAVFARALQSAPAARYARIDDFVTELVTALDRCAPPRARTPVAERGSTEARPSSDDGRPDRLPSRRPIPPEPTASVTDPMRDPADISRTRPMVRPGDDDTQDVEPLTAAGATRPLAPAPKAGRALGGLVLALGVVAVAGGLAFVFASEGEDAQMAHSSYVPRVRPSASPRPGTEEDAPRVVPVERVVPQEAPRDVERPRTEVAPQGERRASETRPVKRAPPERSTEDERIDALARKLDALRRTPTDLDAIRDLARAIEAEADRRPTVKNRVRRLVRASEARADLDGFEGAIRALR